MRTPQNNMYFFPQNIYNTKLSRMSLYSVALRLSFTGAKG